MAEKRRYPRYACSGGADIQIIGMPIHAWGNIADLSRGGMYVEIAEPLPVGSKVDVRVEVQGIAVHATGTLVTCHPGVGVGVVFTELDEENCVDLETIVRDLESANRITS